MAISGHRPQRLECKNPRRNAAVYHAKRLGFFRDLTVKNAVFRCSSYVALPAIIPHGRGECERFVYSGYGDVGYSVSQDSGWKYLKNERLWKIAYRKLRGVVYLQAENQGSWKINAKERRNIDEILPDGYRPSFDTPMSATGIGNDIGDSACYVNTEGIISLYFLAQCDYFRVWCSYPV